MKVMVVILLTLTLACTALLGEAPTPRPTYTPYPTQTPVAPVAQVTSDVPPTPTISPERFGRAGKNEWFSGNTAKALGRGEEAFAQGKYQEALHGFLEAQRLHGAPSLVLQNWIGNSYQATGQNDKAIKHYTNAIAIEDDAVNRTNRGSLYQQTGQCAMAIDDAKAALAMEPAIGDGSHTDVEANLILSQCYVEQGDNLAALQHADAAYALATEHNVRTERIEEIRDNREAVQLILESKAWPEDLFSEPVFATIEAASQLYEIGQYSEAVAKFKEAQTQHRTPSGYIETAIGDSYSALGQHDKAIEHYTAALGIRDDAHHRALRAIEYSISHRCAEAISDAEAALAMNPYSEPGYHTSAEAHWTLAICQMANSNEAAALRHLEQATGIARDHGYTEEDIAAISATIGDPADSLAKAIIITPAPMVPPAASEKPETSGAGKEAGLSALTNLQNAKWLQQTHPDTADSLAKLPWVADGVDPTEEPMLEDILYLLYTGFQPGSPDLAGNPLKSVDTLLHMPFLQSVEPGDAQAIRSLRNIAQENSTQLKTILGHPTFQGGITNNWTPTVAALWSAHENNPSLIPTLLDPGQVRLESRNMELPHTGTVELHIVRLGVDRNPKTMDILETAVRKAEFFMALPLPVRMVSVLFADSVTPTYAGNNFGTSITILPEHESNDEHLPAIIAHEVAHYYWSGNQDWIDEGMSNLIEAYHRWQTTGVPMTASTYPCPHFSNIQQLESANPRKNEDTFRCSYSLGERVFLDLWQKMGDVPFREGAQRLYQQTQAGEEGAKIADAITAFDRRETLERWYSGTDTEVGQAIDGDTPTWTLEEIHGSIDDAAIILQEGGAKMTSFSAKSHRGPAYLWFHYNHPTFVEESWTVDLTMVEVFEDGLTYNIRPMEMTVKGIHVGGNWRISVGPQKGHQWKPGEHHVILYDGGGTKVAHVSWSVTS